MSYQPPDPNTVVHLTGGDETGLKAARNPLKVLNHLDLAQSNDQVSQALGLHKQTTPSDLFKANGRALDLHQKRLLSTDQAIACLVHNLRLFDRDLTESEARQLVRRLLIVAQVELHLCDICNESCRGCTFGFDDPRFKPAPVMFPFDRLPAVAAMSPRALLFVGGGEPLLYKDRATAKKFPEAVVRMRQLLPDTPFGLISTGTVYPNGDWIDEFAWVRLSVDAATPETYEAFRGRPYFDRVCTNLLRLLQETRVPQFGVGFVFCSDNIGEAPRAARFFYDLVQTNCPVALPRFNVQYRPLRRDPKDVGRSFPAAVSVEQIHKAESQLLALAAGDAAFARFLREQTNCDVIVRGNTYQEVPFGRCGYSMIFRIVRANGDIRPCCMRIAEPEFHLGNILRDGPETIALNTLYNAAYLRPGCDAQGCKLGGLNRLLERGLAGEAQPSTAPEVVSNPFFG